MHFLTLPFLFLRDIYRQKFLIFQLTGREFKNKYVGSYLGFLWTIIQPFVMIFVLWLVFTKGFHSGPVDGIPFIAWLTCGLIVWDFFSTTLVSGTNVFSDYQYLVKKIQFNVAILPLIKIFSSLITHGIMLLIAMGILIVSGVEFSWYWFQVFYYLFAAIVLLLGMSWITSSFQIFLKDTAQIVNVFIQFGFWLTPIMWQYQMLPEKWQYLLQFHPIFYLVNGYRNSFLFETPFWSNLQSLGIFWGTTGVILLAAVFLFKKLRPHFADVL